jgi:hypothetical protein
MSFAGDELALGRSRQILFEEALLATHPCRPLQDFGCDRIKGSIDWCCGDDTRVGLNCNFKRSPVTPDDLYIDQVCAVLDLKPFVHLPGNLARAKFINRISSFV